MGIDEAIKIIEQETKDLGNTLRAKKVPIEEIYLDDESVGECEPFCAIRIGFNEDWFYDNIEKGTESPNEKDFAKGYDSGVRAILQRVSKWIDGDTIRELEKEFLEGK